jgi:orotidine-5'-phosphate decarboxylase
VIADGCAPEVQLPPLAQRLSTWLANGRPPLAVIVEPRAEVLRWWSLPDSVAGALHYVRVLSDASYGFVALYKIQPASFERFGPGGWAALQRAICILRGSGAGVVIDTKRTDHAPVLRELISTFIGPRSHYAADGLTVLPYLGVPEILDALPAVRDRGGLLLVIARTGNRGAEVVQGARVGAVDVAATVVDAVAAHSRTTPGLLGVVLGGDQKRARELVPRSSGIVVLPGWGRPGVDTTEMRRTRDLAPERVLVSMGSKFVAEGPHTAGLRAYLKRAAAALQ